MYIGPVGTRTDQESALPIRNYIWLRERLTESRDAFWAAEARMHEFTADGPPSLAFAMGQGAGETLNLLEAFGRLVELHRPTESPHDIPRCAECLGERGDFEAWPCDSAKELASTYKHHRGYKELWGS